jgi:hypothetical protein
MTTETTIHNVTRIAPTFWQSTYYMVSCSCSWVGEFTVSYPAAAKRVAMALHQSHVEVTP